MKKNYFRFKQFKDGYLLTNELGRYIFLDKESFEHLMHGSLSDDQGNKDIVSALKEKYFLWEGDELSFVETVGNEYRNYRQYLFAGPQLHIFVITKQCNQKCIYCQASANNDYSTRMSEDTAKKAVDLALQSPSKYLTFEFQGGEPLLNFDILKFIVEYTEKNKKDKEIEYTVVSNLMALDSAKLKYLTSHCVNITTSLDGNGELHNKNRPIDSKDAFKSLSDKITLLREKNISFSAIQTTTSYSLNMPKEIIDQYISFGLNQVFLRPLTPLGHAAENWEKIGYSPEEFLDFYSRAIDYLIEVNKAGIYIAEGHATMFLKKIIHNDSGNYMELRSPCGGGIGQIAYYYNGKIYSCDEARMISEMGDDSFCLGSVDANNLNEIISSPVCRLLSRASCLEGLSECGDCVYAPYCGTCPVISYAKYGTLYPTMIHEYRCEIYKGMLDILFMHLLKNDATTNQVFESWTGGM